MLSYFLRSVHEYTQAYSAGKSSNLGAVIINNLTKLVDWQQIDIAIITVGWQPCENDTFRNILYNLQQSNRTYRIADLGCLLEGTSLQTSTRLQKVCEFLLSHQVIPFILACDHALDVSQFAAYEHMKKSVYMLQIDKHLDLDEASSTHLEEIINYQPNLLIGAGLLAYQEYLTNPLHLQRWQQLGFDLLSIGKMRNHFQQVEPLIRSADMISFDLQAVRPFFSPPHHSFPFGLTPEEACQIAWYAGKSEHLTSLGIYGYVPEGDSNGMMAALVATMCWYFIEGYDRSQKNPDFSQPCFVKHIVPLSDRFHLVFYKHIQSEKWWMELPCQQSTLLRFERPKAIPCSYQDYLTACEGLPPDRWIQFSVRLG
ncbi:MAG: arginase family protein [Cytophagales bacterium]|nr:arginase family protein [Bernardetiaceae bacterium]MDW8209845.1 arginase family protein [Cytophagales bacterium]